MIYLFDTNTILEAKNRYYSFHFCPGFWDWLEKENRQGNILSIMPVKSELKDEDSMEWVKKNTNFFEDANTQRLTDVVNWVTSRNQYSEAAKNKFLTEADPQIIAHALACNYTVVTLERPAPKSRTSIKIPDVCTEFKIPCCNTYDVLKKLNARLILQ